MSKELIGVWEPVFTGKHVSEMTDAEVEEFAAWFAGEAVKALEEHNGSTA